MSIKNVTVIDLALIELLAGETAAPADVLDALRRRGLIATAAGKPRLTPKGRRRAEAASAARTRHAAHVQRGRGRPGRRRCTPTPLAVCTSAAGGRSSASDSVIVHQKRGQIMSFLEKLAARITGRREKVASSYESLIGAVADDKSPSPEQAEAILGEAGRLSDDAGGRRGSPAWAPGGAGGSRQGPSRAGRTPPRGRRAGVGGRQAAAGCGPGGRGAFRRRRAAALSASGRWSGW